MIADAETLRCLFSPRSVAIVGARPKSSWANAAYRNLKTMGFEGKFFAVNRSGEKFQGHQSYKSCSAISDEVDVALLVVPAGAVSETLDDLAAARIGVAIIIASGFAELGPAGRAAEAEVREKAARLGIRLLGPNCLGVANFVDRTGLWAGGVSPQKQGGLAIVSQSGAVAISIHRYAIQQGVAHSHMVSTGNELDIDVSDAILFLLQDERVRAIALFIETVRDTKKFEAACAAARAAGKPIVVLKVGRSEHTAKVAQAHTGAMVGDDRVFDAFCKQNGLIRVNSLDELVHTADAFLKAGPIAGRRIAAISISGGLSEVCADLAALAGLDLCEFSAETVARLKEFLPDYAGVNCPLDLTGLATTQPDMGGRAVAAIAMDAGVDLVVYVFEVPESDLDASPFSEEMLQSVAEAARAAGKPVVVMSHQVKIVSNYAARIIERLELPYISGGLQFGLAALASIAAWRMNSRAIEDDGDRITQSEIARTTASKLTTEYRAQQFLKEFGVSVVPTYLAGSEKAAEEAASLLGDKVVLKISSPQIAHKTEVGGVRIGIEPDHAAAEFSRMIERVRLARPDAAIDGVLVAPMRSGGLELIVGVVRDPQWGLVLAVGFGGVFVEMIKDVSMRLLPVGSSQIRQMLKELSGARLLNGFRGNPPTDIEALVGEIQRICAAALSLDGLDTLEINPLRVSGSQIEALDALVVPTGE